MFLLLINAEILITSKHSYFEEPIRKNNITSKISFHGWKLGILFLSVSISAPVPSAVVPLVRPAAASGFQIVGDLCNGHISIIG